MKTLHKQTPFSDNKLEWNAETEQYEVAFQYCKANFDDNFIDDETLKKRIKKNSRKIYRYISNHTYSANRPIVNKVLNYTEEGRQFLFDILTIQMEADVETGFNDLSSTPAINVANGQIIERNELYRNQICVDAEQVFDDSDKYFGFRIGYQCPFPQIYFTLFK